MAANFEVIVPNPHDRRLFKGLSTSAKIVAAPSERANVDGIVVAGMQFFGNLRGAELVFQLREHQKDLPIVFFFTDDSHTSLKEIALFQNIAIASAPSEPVFVAPNEDTVTRIIRAHTVGAAKSLIATARIEAEQLWVWSCEPRLYHCPLSSFPTLRNLNDEQLRKFEISNSGSRLRWPALDVDLSLESILAEADPAIRAEQERQHRKAAKGYAQAIRKLREKHGLAQSEVVGLSDRAVRRIEHGERIPQMATLEKLAKAHRMTVSEYMNELATLSANGAKAKRRKGPALPRYRNVT